MVVTLVPLLLLHYTIYYTKLHYTTLYTTLNYTTLHYPDTDMRNRCYHQRSRPIYSDTAICTSKEVVILTTK